MHTDLYINKLDAPSAKKYLGNIDILILVGILTIFNIHLLTGNFCFSLIFTPAAVKCGQWWRLITHPFVHVSFYHLLLDAGAFLLLYQSLENKKIVYMMACGIGSLMVALFVSPLIYTHGLCGLSGIAHGLMAVSGLEMMTHKKSFKIGVILFLIIVFKSIYEVISGDVIFSFMHMGLCGSPIAPCHIGGVLGGIIAFYFLNSNTTFIKPQSTQR